MVWFSMRYHFSLFYQEDRDDEFLGLQELNLGLILLDLFGHQFQIAGVARLSLVFLLLEDLVDTLLIKLWLRLLEVLLQ